MSVRFRKLMLRTVCVSKSKTAETLYHLKLQVLHLLEFFNSVPLNAISLDDTSEILRYILFSLESLKNHIAVILYRRCLNTSQNPILQHQFLPVLWQEFSRLPFFRRFLPWLLQFYNTCCPILFRHLHHQIQFHW